MSNQTEGEKWHARFAAIHAQVSRMPIDALRNAHAKELLDWCDTDTAVRELARRVLTDNEIDGSSYGVPPIEYIVEALVKKVEFYKALSEESRPDED